MKNFSRITSLALALIMVMGLALTANAAATNWQQMKDVAHQNAQNARYYYGMGDNAIAVRSQSILWHYADGNTNAAEAWFYDPLQNQYFDFWGNTYVPDPKFNATADGNGYRGSTINQDGYTWEWDGWQYYRWQNGAKVYLNTGNNKIGNGYTSNGVSFKWNGYQWYQVADGTFYRWDGTGSNRKTVWATSSEIEKIFKNGTYMGNTYYDTFAQASGNTSNTTTNVSTNSSISDGGYVWQWDASAQQYYRWNGSSKIWYNQWKSQQTTTNDSRNLFAGVNWYSGLLKPAYDAELDREARQLLCLTGDYVKNLESQTTQGDFMKLANNIANGADLSSASGSFPKYNANFNANTKDVKGRSLYDLAYDQAYRMKGVRNGVSDVGFRLPSQYTYFSVTGQTVQFKDKNGNIWNSTGVRSPFST